MFQKYNIQISVVFWILDFGIVSYRPVVSLLRRRRRRRRRSVGVRRTRSLRCKEEGTNQNRETGVRAFCLFFGLLLQNERARGDLLPLCFLLCRFRPPIIPAQTNSPPPRPSCLSCHQRSAPDKYCPEIPVLQITPSYMTKLIIAS